ncbi:hypothetical protein C2S51_033107 [Perilla frutescens var. frutescens]|nr:hypothetical protein C2S51_033107 [Perilla frutescens var. frutescens]
MLGVGLWQVVVAQQWVCEGGSRDCGDRDWKDWEKEKRGECRWAEGNTKEVRTVRQRQRSCQHRCGSWDGELIGR